MNFQLGSPIRMLPGNIRISAKVENSILIIPSVHFYKLTIPAMLGSSQRMF